MEDFKEYFEVRGGKGNALRAKMETKQKIRDLNSSGNNVYLVSIFDMLVFDENDNLCVSINSLSDCKINFEDCIIEAKDVTFNLSLIKFISKYQDIKLTDYKNLTKLIYSKIIGKSSVHARKCKIILEGDLYSSDGTLKHTLKYCFPSCLIFSQELLESSSIGVGEYPIKIEFEYDKNIDGYYEIILE